MIRSLFFAPANRPDLAVKFPRFGADCSVLDLEDATPAEHKESARASLVDTVRAVRDAGLKGLLAVRVNAPGSPHYLRDVEAALSCGIDALVVPKLEDIAQVFPVAHYLAQTTPETHGRKQPFVIAGLESIRGVLNSAELCARTAHLGAVYFGSEDFAAEMGARRTREGHELATARSMVLMAAKAAGLRAIDQAVVDIRDDARFMEDASRGRDLGYQGKICVAPAQVALAHAAFSPSEAELQHARRVVDAYDNAIRRGIGAIDFEGVMVDGPVLKRALDILDAGGRAE